MSDAGRVGREHGLRAAVLAGDARAWQRWYDEAFAALDAYVVWRCGGLRDRADDVLQETWLAAVRGIRRFDPERASFAAWLRGIAANVMRNRFRASRRRPTVSLNGELPHADRPQEDGERITAALAALPDHYERVLRAKYLDGRSVAEIAAESGESPKAIESLLTRARAAFREAYGED
ncbi:MAG: RNA polymerase sigma factor [Gemmataceae bacterium]